MDLSNLKFENNLNHSNDLNSLTISNDSINIENLKQKIDEYLKNNIDEIKNNTNLEEISKNASLGEITVEKTAFKDINEIKEKINKDVSVSINKIEKTVEDIKEKEDTKGIGGTIIQTGLDKVYELVKDTIFEKAVSKLIENAKMITQKFLNTSVGQNIKDNVLKYSEKGVDFIKSVSSDIYNSVKALLGKILLK